MISLQAPYNNIAMTTFLPSPTFNDTLGLGLEMVIKKSINNTRYTYVKNKGKDKFNYTILMDYQKALELQHFFELYITDYIKLTNHLNEIWKVRVVSDPFTYGLKTINDWTEVLIVFEGVKIYAPNIIC